jgi:hypothetical protein
LQQTAQKERPPAAAVLPKSNQVFGSGGCECSNGFPLPAPRKQTHHTKATSEKWEGGW